LHPSHLQPRRLAVALLIGGLLVGAAPAEAEALRLTLRPTLALHMGYDSNARRIPQTLGDDDTRSPDALPPTVVEDGLLIARAGLLAAVSQPGLSLRANGTVGTKLFLDSDKPPPDTPDWERARAATRTDGARMLVGQGTLALSQTLPLGFVNDFSIYGKARAQKNLQRTYTFSESRWTLRHALPLGVSARGGLRGLFFHSVDTPLFTSFGGGAHGGARWHVTPRDSFDVDLDAAVRAYPFLNPFEDDGELRRIDVPTRLSLSFTSVRRIFVSAGYTLLRNSSNTAGETYLRHRLHGMTGLRLPAEVTASLRGSLQVTQYDQGISVGQRLLLQDTDESQNSLSLGLSRPWAFGTTLEARLAWYGNELTKGVSQFSRTTAELGIRMDL